MPALITQEERARLQAAVGSRETIVAAAIARLHLASPDPKAARRKDPDSILRVFKNLRDDEWTTTNVVGALVLVIDRSADAIMFQIYDLQRYSLRFQFELYYDITYDLLSPMFHAVEIEDAVAGFCFADADEARSMVSKVMALRPTTKAAGGAALVQQGGKKKGFLRGVFGGKGAGGNGKGRGRESLQIGAVRMVQHQQHVGVNADGTFDVNHLAPQWKQLFKQAGVKKKDLQDPETAAAIMATIAQAGRKQQLAGLYQTQPEYEDMDEGEIEDAVGDMDEAELEEYERYEEELRRYHEELAAYEAEQEALAAWEADNAELVRRLEEEQRAAEAAQDAQGVHGYDDDDTDVQGGNGRAVGSQVSSKSPPPPLPPRKDLKRADKELQEREKEARVQAKAAERADRQLNDAVRTYRQSIRRAQKSPEEEAYERAAEEARMAAEKAKAAAEEAARERDEIMREIEEMRKRNAEARSGVTAATQAATRTVPSASNAAAAAEAARAKQPAKRVTSRRLPSLRGALGRKSSSRPAAADDDAPPPPPPLPAPLKSAALPPPPPPLPTLPPAPPKMPALPALPKLPQKPKGALDASALQAGISGTKLKKAPQPKARAPGVPRPKTGLLGAIESGVALKPTAQRKQSKLPDLQAMKPKAQNALMASLIETMNTRRAVMNDGDSDSGWSD